MQRIWVRWIRWLGLCICLATIGVGLLLAQTDTDNTRIISAIITEGTRLTVQVAVSPDTSIDSVTVDLPDDTLTLTPSDTTLTEERWLLLDGGRDMLNVESEIRDELRALLADEASARRSGLIIFQDEGEPQVIAPDDDVAVVREAVTAYEANANTVGCVGDALTAFNRYQSDTPDTSVLRRVLLITGNTACEEDLPTMTTPVDIVILGRANSQLISLAEQGNTTINTSNLLTFDSVLADVLSRWETDLRSYATTVNMDIASATVILTLADGQTVARTVNVTGTFTTVSTPTATHTPAPTATATPITINSSAEADSTGAETDASEDDDAGSQADALMERGDLVQLLVIFLFAALMIGSAFFARLMRQRKREKAISESVDTRMEATQHIVLALLRDKDTATPYHIHIPETILGRGGESTLIIQDALLSREHVRFTETDKHGLLMTRLSQAEVLVNGKPVERAQQLYVGDEITLSPDTSLRVERIDDDI